MGIFSNNRDEFYRVRVATINRLTKLGKKAIDIYGDDPKELLQKLQRKVIEQQQNFEEIYQELLLELANQNVFIINEKQLNAVQQQFVKDYFHKEVETNLFPIMVDENKPFPYMKDKSGYLFIRLISTIQNQKTNTHLLKYLQNQLVVLLFYHKKKIKNILFF